jgi:ribonuclease-3
MPRGSGPSRTPSTTSTSTPPDGRVPIQPAEQADRLATRLRLPPGDRAFLAEALVHSSYFHEHPDEASGHNERLELLGDAVVNLAVTEALFSRHPADDEGVLSARRAAVVSSAGLARLAGRIDLGDYLLLGEGEAQISGRRRPALLAAAFEAVVGAIFLGHGWEVTRGWLVDLAGPEISADLPEASLKSPKSRLQEIAQRTYGVRPEYRLLDATGPDHRRTFRISVVLDERTLGVGEGESRRIAETAAAAAAIETLERETVQDAPSAERAADREASSGDPLP